MHLRLPALLRLPSGKDEVEFSRRFKAREQLKRSLGLYLCGHWAEVAGVSDYGASELM